MCLCVGNVLMRHVCFARREAGQAGCVARPTAEKKKKSLPTPTHNNPPQNYGFVAEDTPASLMHLKYVCLSANVCVLVLRAFQGSHRRTAHQQHALDSDEGQHFCSS